MKPYQQAFLEPLHLLTVIGFTALTPAFGDPLPLFIAGAGEALYLLYVPESKWYSALRERRTIASFQTKRERQKREILPGAIKETQNEFARMELLYKGYVSGSQYITPTIAERYEGLFEQYLRFVSKEITFEKQLTSLAEASALPADLQGQDRNERIIAHCREQIAWYRELIHSVGNAPGSSVADAGRQITLMEERIAYVENVSRLQEAVRRERHSIGQIFLTLTPDTNSNGEIDGVAAIIQARAERLWHQLAEASPSEKRVAQLLGA